MTTLTNIPAPRVGLLDPRTGLMSREWYLFLLTIFDRVGGESVTQTNATSVLDNYTPANSDVHLLCNGTFTITLQATNERIGELIVTNAGTGVISFIGSINSDTDKKIAFENTSIRLRPTTQGYKIV